MWPNSAVQSQSAASQQQQRTLGMTSAISQAHPKAVDVQRTKELEEALNPYNVFETDAELNHR
jgi:poly(A) polymerase